MTSARPSCTVLVVDSCADTQARIHEHLQGRGCSIITAADPEAAALATEAQTYAGAEAVKLGLVDGIVDNPVDAFGAFVNAINRA